MVNPGNTRNITKILGSVVAVLAVVLQSPQVQHAIVPFLTRHDNLGALVGAIAAIAALLHNPKQGTEQ